MTGDNNTAIGYGVLEANTIGSDNTAIGYHAGWSTDTGSSNTAIGRNALAANGGSQNTAIGVQALENNASGNNTAIGYLAGSNNTSGTQNTTLGAFAGLNVTTADNVICIGGSGDNVSDSCYIGNIWQQPGGPQAVYVNSNGKLGTQVSSQRFKDEIKPMEQTSEIIYGLKPVSFRYKAEIEPTRPLGFGLIAEEVEKISSDLVTRGLDGRVNSVRYDAVNAMLLNEFLKEHQKNEEQRATIAKLTSKLQTVIARLEQQAAQIQKVSAQLEMVSPALRTVVENR